MLKLVEYIRNHKDWRESLAKAPYYISVKEDYMYGHNLAIFKYNQLDSDFNNEIVRECRGIILDVDSLEPICVPFFKFGNYGESYCPEIDWKSAKVLTKIDGSLIKIVNLEGHLLISTNGTIDAEKAPIEALECPYKSYKELVLNAVPLKGLSEEYLLNVFEKGYTYMFELTSIYNKVVIPYEGIQLHLIGIRNNQSLKEIYIKEHPLAQMFSTPKEFGFTNLDECISSAKALPYTDEGYVVLDKNFNRVKVKSPAYVAIHHLKGEGILTMKKALSLIQANELEEVLNYFPEYKEFALNLHSKYQKLSERLDYDWLSYLNSWFPMESRKEFAYWVMRNCLCPAFMFSKYDGKCSCGKDYISKIGADTLSSLLEKID